MKVYSLEIEGEKIVFAKTPWFEPYQEGRTKSGRRRTNFAKYVPSNQKHGVYLIRSKQSKKILYAGYSDFQLRKTLYRHFQKWDGDKNSYFEQYRATFKNAGSYEVQILIPKKPEKVELLESYFFKKHQPKYNKLDTGPTFRKGRGRVRRETGKSAEDFVPF